MTFIWIVDGFAVGQPLGYRSPHGHRNICIKLTMPEVERRKGNLLELEAPGASDHHAIVGWSFGSLAKGFHKGSRQEIRDFGKGETGPVSLWEMRRQAQQRFSRSCFMLKEVSQRGYHQPGEKLREERENMSVVPLPTDDPASDQAVGNFVRTG